MPDASIYASTFLEAPQGFLSPMEIDGSVFYCSRINPYDTPDIWSTLEDSEARYSASDLTEEEIAALSTEALTLHCMNYNFICDMYAFDTMSDGLDVICGRYNAIKALLARPDAGEVLIRLFEMYDTDEQAEKDEFALLRFDFLESLIYRLHSKGGLTREQSRRFALQCFKKLQRLLDAGKGAYNIDYCMLIGTSCLYASDAGFAAIADGCALHGCINADAQLGGMMELSDEELGRIARYIDGLI